MKNLTILTILLISNCVFAKSFYGTWKVESVTHKNMASISAEKAKDLVGTALVLSGRSSKSGEQYCDNTKYEVEFFDNSDLFLYYKVEFSNLKLDVDKLEHVMVLCNNRSWNKFGHIFLYTPSDELIVIYDGYFFELSRSTLNQALKKDANNSAS